MPSHAEPTATPSASLQQQVADALQNRTLPISKLLRLMWALDAEPAAGNENLRAQLRQRIGAPLHA